MTGSFRGSRPRYPARPAPILARDDRTSNDAPEVVASVGPLDAVVVLLREFLHRSGACARSRSSRARRGDEPAIVDVRRLLPHRGRGRRTEGPPPPRRRARRARRPSLPRCASCRRFDVDVESGEIAAPPGGVAHLASAVRDVAELLGGRNVALVQFETNHPEAPLAITARAGGDDPLVLALGEEEFEMDPGWPDAPSPSA